MRLFVKIDKTICVKISHLRKEGALGEGCLQAWYQVRDGDGDALARELQHKYGYATYTNTDDNTSKNTNTNTNTCRDATGTVGRVADKGRERDAGSAERWYCWPTGTGTWKKYILKHKHKYKYKYVYNYKNILLTNRDWQMKHKIFKHKKYKEKYNENKDTITNTRLCCWPTETGTLDKYLQYKYKFLMDESLRIHVSLWFEPVANCLWCWRWWCCSWQGGLTESSAMKKVMKDFFKNFRDLFEIDIV